MPDVGRSRRALVVEDDRAIAELIATYLARDGLDTRVAYSGENALTLLDWEADIVLLDLGLPGMDGLDFLRAFRAHCLAPVIIVSARESDEAKLEGLGLGADDFVTKPFSPRLLAARVAALLRRVEYGRLHGAAPDPPGGRIGFGPFVLDSAARILLRDGTALPLSRREFELLAFLAGNQGRSFSAADLHRAVWRLEHGDLSTVAVHVQRIRRKIEEDPGSPRWIRTVPGFGYRFVPEGDE